MNPDIRYLQLLEDDLRDAAEIERELDVEQTAGAGRGRAGSGPRRLPRRGWSWSKAAAAIVALLVVAGGIGFLTQPKSSDSRAASAPALQGKVADVAHRASLDIPSASPAAGFEGVAGPDDSLKAIDPSTNQGVAGAPAKVPFTATGQGNNSIQSLAGGQSDLSKIERDGAIGILIPDKTFSKHVGAVTAIATSNHGMVLNSSTQDERTGTFTLRLPASHFEHAMLQLRAMGAAEGAEILSASTTAQDVTAQFVDFKARLDIVRGTKARLVSLQSHATTTSQILFLGNQIDQVQLQIEQLQGQINFINNQVAESTIRVELREKDAPAAQTTNSVEQPSLGSAWSRSLQGFLRVIGSVIVGLGYLIPVGIIALGVWFVVTLVRRKRRVASSAP
jgi:hypothetical protein